MADTANTVANERKLTNNNSSRKEEGVTMKLSTHKVPLATMLAGAVALAVAIPALTIFTFATAQATQIFTATLAFETEFLDLDANVISAADSDGDASGADIRIAFNADRSPGAVVFGEAAAGVELAFVAGMSFDGVTAESVAGLTFSAEPVDAPFSASDTVLVRTDSGLLFKLGNAVETETGVTFSYAAL